MMKLTILIVGILCLLVASTQGGTLRKKSPARTLSPEEIRAEKLLVEKTKMGHLIKSELKEILLAFSKERTMLKSLSSHLCRESLSETLSMISVKKGDVTTAAVNKACGEDSLFGKDLNRFYKHMVQCPKIKNAYNNMKVKVYLLRQTAQNLYANYTKARERFQVTHDYELGQDIQHSVIVKSLGKLIGNMDTHIMPHFGIDTESKPSKVDDRKMEDPNAVVNKEDPNAIVKQVSLLEVDPETDEKGRIKKIRWTMEHLHQRMKSAHDIEVNETKRLKRAWEQKERVWMERIDVLAQRLKHLQAEADEKLDLNNICSCKKRRHLPHFKSLDPSVFLIESPKFYHDDVLAKQEVEDRNADDAATKIERETAGNATDGATADATDGATGGATDGATGGATGGATDGATGGATDGATGGATEPRTNSNVTKTNKNTTGATGSATGGATEPTKEATTHSNVAIANKCDVKGACDALTKFCDREKQICRSKLNDGETCSDDGQCQHVCHENKCQAEKYSGDACTAMKECNPTYLYCDVKTKTCNYRRHNHEMCTNNDMVVDGHYCRGGYVAAYKLENETCEVDDRCEPTQSSDFSLECINKVCRNKHASNAFIELPSIVDKSFEPDVCVEQATKYAESAVRNLVRTHNHIKQKYEDMEKNIADMKNIEKLISADILPAVGLQLLKQVDEVFDQTLVHKPMLASSEPQSWTVSNLDYFHDVKRYFKFKAVSWTSNVQVAFQKVDLECKYDYMQYFESTDCDDNKAKEALFQPEAKKVCNTVMQANHGVYKITPSPIILSGKCIYVRLYSDYMVDGNNYDLHRHTKEFEGLRATYKSI